MIMVKEKVKYKKEVYDVYLSYIGFVDSVINYAL